MIPRRRILPDEDLFVGAERTMFHEAKSDLSFVHNELMKAGADPTDVELLALMATNILTSAESCNIMKAVASAQEYYALKRDVIRGLAEAVSTGQIILTADQKEQLAASADNPNAITRLITMNLIRSCKCTQEPRPF